MSQKYALFQLFLVSLCLHGCGDDGDHHGEHEHPPGGNGSHHNDSGHDHAAHMAHMRQVRDSLKKELGDQYDAEVLMATQEQLAAGKTIYLKTCFTCHGTTGKGDGPTAKVLKQPPADFTDHHHATFYSDQGRLHIIRKDIPETPMIGWDKALSEDDIISVHAYVRSLR